MERESTLLYIFLPDGVFLTCDYRLDFDISFCESSIDQSVNTMYYVVCMFSTFSRVIGQPDIVA